MVNPDFVPSLECYQEKSKSIEGVPRCPFAALRRCPKYYSSVWLMGEIDETEDKKLRKYWEQTDCKRSRGYHEVPTSVKWEESRLYPYRGGGGSHRGSW